MSRPWLRDIRPSAGFTLIELLVVLLILASVAGVVVSKVTEVGASADTDVTTVRLAEARDALMGAKGSPGYFGDMLRLPDRMVDLFRMPAGAADYLPATGLGWRGPYLVPVTGSYAIDPLKGFTSTYGADGDPAITDTWGAPIVLQLPDPDGDGVLTATDRQHVRLVSAGADGVIQTPLTGAQALTPGDAYFPSRTQCQDDLVLYVRVADQRPN